VRYDDWGCGTVPQSAHGRCVTYRHPGCPGIRRGHLLEGSRRSTVPYCSRTHCISSPTLRSPFGACLSVVGIVHSKYRRPVPDLWSVLPERCSARGADPAARRLSTCCQAASAGLTPCMRYLPPFTRSCAFFSGLGKKLSFCPLTSMPVHREPARREHGQGNGSALHVMLLLANIQ
jgi:hypothetical protein